MHNSAKDSQTHDRGRNLPACHAGRFGHDDFAILLPETRGEDASVLAERIRSGIGGTPLDSGEGCGITMSATLGVAGLREGVSTPRELIDAAAVEPMITWGTHPGTAVPVTGRVPAAADQIADQRDDRGGLSGAAEGQVSDRDHRRRERHFRRLGPVRRRRGDR